MRKMPESVRPLVNELIGVVDAALGVQLCVELCRPVQAQAELRLLLDRTERAAALLGAVVESRALLPRDPDLSPPELRHTDRS